MDASKINDLSNRCRVTLLSAAIAGLLVGAPVQAQESDEFEEIVVLGIRGSLERAQDIKRSADSVVDVITVEDLGKFSDDSVADSLSRVPGVQIERNDDGRDGARISIRGLGSQFSTTTVNGRPIYSAGAEGQRELRSFSYDTLPSEVYNEIVVRKTPTADHVEAGLAGQVDIKTLRPLEASPLRDKTFYASVSATAQDHELAGSGSKFTGMIGGQNGGETFGWYVSALLGDVNIGTLGNEFEQPQTGRTVTIGSQTYTGVRTPGATSIEDIFEAQERESAVAAIEWAPSDTFSLVADINYSDYTRDIFRSRTSLDNVASITADPVFAAGTAEVVADEFGNNQLVYADFGGVQSYGDTVACPDVATCAPRITQVPLVFDHFTETTLGGVKFDWQATEKLNVQGDVYFSTVDFIQDLAATVAFNTDPDFSFDTRAGGPAIYEVAPSALQNTAGTATLDLAVFGRTFDLNVDSIGYALDFDYELDMGAFSTLEFGVRYTETDFTRLEATGVNGAEDLSAADQQAALDAIYTGNTLDSGYGFSLLQHDEAALRGVLAGGLPVDTFNNLAERGTTLTTDLTEETTSVYVQVRGEFELGNIPTTFNAGLRGVTNDYSGSGPTLINGGPGSTSGETDFEILPSLNFNLALTDDVALRVGLGRSVSLPEVEQLIRPISATPRTCDAGLPSCVATPLAASAGNPNLDPASAWTFDTTLEIYTPNDGSIVLSHFYKEISDFVRDDTFFGTVAAPAGDTVAAEGTPVTALISGPINFSDGEVNGFEIGFNQPIYNGLGMQANYTKVNSSFDENVGDAGLGFPGASEDNFNAVLYYENDKFGTRVTYTYRSDFLASLNAATQTSAVQEAQFAEGWDQVNISASYNFTDSLSVRVAATDIFESERRDFVGSTIAFRAFYQRGRTVAATLTGRF